MTPHTQRGDLDTVRWLHEHGWRINYILVFEAAKRGHIHLLEYFYDHDITHCGCEEGIWMHVINYAARCGHLELLKRVAECNDGKPLDAPNAIDRAASCGHLHAMKYPHEHNLSGCTPAAISDAAGGGHLEVAVFLHQNRTEGCAPDALDRTAPYGHLEAVQFLHDNYSALRCSVDAMDQTAANGHLEVLKLLYESRIGQCSAAAIDDAAGSGHLEVVKCLHENHNTEGCSPTAMDRAAERGHLEVVKFLFHNRTADCLATAAIRIAARNKHLRIVQFLCEDHHHYHCEGENTILAAMQEAASSDHLEITKLLHSRLEPWKSAYPAVKAAVQGSNHKIVQFLCENQQLEAVCFLKQTIADPGASGRIIRCLREYSSVKELSEAKRYPMGLQKPVIALRIAQHIQAMRRTRRC